jgi:hypothetical protein
MFVCGNIRFVRVLEVLRGLASVFAAAGYGAEQMHKLIARDGRHGDFKSSISSRSNGPHDVGDDFLLATTIQANRQLLSNIDAIDGALIGILGAAVAFAVLTVDKIKELPEPARSVAIGLLAGSGLLSFVGYAYAFVRGEPIESPRPIFFVPDFVRNGPKAIARALHEAIEATEYNRRIRTAKRMGALTAIALLIGGAIVVGVARIAS